MSASTASNGHACSVLPHLQARARAASAEVEALNATLANRVSCVRWSVAAWIPAGSRIITRVVLEYRSQAAWENVMQKPSVVTLDVQSRILISGLMMQGEVSLRGRLATSLVAKVAPAFVGLVYWHSMQIRICCVECISYCPSLLLAIDVIADLMRSGISFDSLSIRVNIAWRWWWRSISCYPNRVRALICQGYWIRLECLRVKTESEVASRVRLDAAIRCVS
jgi:hypothetical protein